MTVLPSKFFVFFIRNQHWSIIEWLYGSTLINYWVTLWLRLIFNLLAFSGQRFIDYWHGFHRAMGLSPEKKPNTSEIHTCLMPPWPNLTWQKWGWGFKIANTICVLNLANFHWYIAQSSLLMNYTVFWNAAAFACSTSVTLPYSVFYVEPHAKPIKWDTDSILISKLTWMADLQVFQGFFI